MESSSKSFPDKIKTWSQNFFGNRLLRRKMYISDSSPEDSGEMPTDKGSSMAQDQDGIQFETDQSLAVLNSSKSFKSPVSEKSVDTGTSDEYNYLTSALIKKKKKTLKFKSDEKIGTLSELLADDDVFKEIEGKKFTICTDILLNSVQGGAEFFKVSGALPAVAVRRRNSSGKKVREIRIHGRMRKANPTTVFKGFMQTVSVTKITNFQPRPKPMVVPILWHTIERNFIHNKEDELSENGTENYVSMTSDGWTEEESIGEPSGDLFAGDKKSNTKAIESNYTDVKSDGGSTYTRYSDLFDGQSFIKKRPSTKVETMKNEVLNLSSNAGFKSRLGFGLVESKPSTNSFLTVSEETTDSSGDSDTGNPSSTVVNVYQSQKRPFSPAKTCQLNLEPVASITITRSRSRITRCANGEEHCQRLGREFVTLKAPQGIYYSRHLQTANLLVEIDRNKI